MDEDRYVLTFTATPGVCSINDGEAYYPQVMTQFGNEEPIYVQLTGTRYATRGEALAVAGQLAAREVARFQNVAERFKSDYKERQLKES